MRYASCSETYIINLVFSVKTHIRLHDRMVAQANRIVSVDTARHEDDSFKINTATAWRSQRSNFIKYSNLCIHAWPAHLVDSIHSGCKRSAFIVQTYIFQWFQSKLKNVCVWWILHHRLLLLLLILFRSVRVLLWTRNSVCSSGRWRTEFHSTTYLHHISYDRIWVNNSTIYARESTYTHTHVAHAMRNEQIFTHTHTRDHGQHRTNGNSLCNWASAMRTRCTRIARIHAQHKFSFDG